MTTGSWNKGNGVVVSGYPASSSSVSIVWTKSWNGADSYTPRSIAVYARDENGKPLYRDKDGYKYAPAPALDVPVVPGKGPEPRFSSFVNLVPNALKFREEVALGEPPKLPFYPSWNDEHKPKRQRLKPNAYTMTTTKRVDAAIGYYVWSGLGSTCFPSNKFWQTGWLMRDFGGNGNWSATNLLTANDQIRLVQKLSEKIQGSGFNLAVSLGEGRQALAMIGDSATRIANALRLLKKGDVLGAWKALYRGLKAGRTYESLPGFTRLKKQVDTETQERWKHWLLVNPKWRKRNGNPRKGARQQFLRELDLSDRPVYRQSTLADDFSSWWLQMSYGWIPLLKDAEDGAKFLAHQLSVPIQVRYTVQVRKEQNQSRVSSITWCPSPSKRIDIYSTTSQHHIRRLTAYFVEKPSIPKLSGLLAPESVAWELMPWSFVIDWFIPIGDWLEARSFAQGLNGTFVTTDYKVGKAYPPHTGAGHLSVASMPAGETPGYWSATVDRVISTTLDVPRPSVKPLAKALSWRHCVSALALLIQARPSTLK